MENCKANVLLAEDARQLSKFVPLAPELPHLKAVVQWVGQPEEEARRALEEGRRRVRVMSWQELVDLGRKEGDDPLDGRLKQVTPIFNRSKKCHIVVPVYVYCSLPSMSAATWYTPPAPLAIPRG